MQLTRTSLECRGKEAAKGKLMVVATVTGRLHGTSSDRPVGPTVGRIKHVSFCRTADPTVVTGKHYVRLVGPTGQSDDQSRCSVGGTMLLTS